MSLYKRKGSPHWWVRFTHNGRRVQQSAGTADRNKAQEFYDQLRDESRPVDLQRLVRTEALEKIVSATALTGVRFVETGKG